MNILDVKSVAGFDDSITSLQHHAYAPYTTSYDYGDEVRISIQQQDLYVLPSDSYIYIEGEIVKKTLPADATEDQKVAPKIINNAAAFLFQEIRYEINGFEIDRCKNPGITTTMKGMASYTSDDTMHLKISGWN